MGGLPINILAVCDVALIFEIVHCKRIFKALYVMSGRTVFTVVIKTDFICAQIPAWIKQELRDVDDGNDAEVDDTSDHSDEEVVQKTNLHDSSMSSIQINKDLSHGTIALLL